MYSLDSCLRISWFLQLWRPLVFLCICCFWALYAVAQADEPKGKPQPSVSGKPQDSAAKKPQPSDGGTSNTKPDSNTLLNSPDAREVAPYVCSHKHESDCPLTQEIETMIKQHFRQPLQNGRKGDTELAVAIKNLLNQEYAGAPIWESKISYAVIHLVDEGSGDAGVMPNRWILAQRKRKGIELSESLRILGAKNITVIFLHVRAETGADDPRDAFGDISYRAIVEHKIPVNLSNLFGVLKFAIANAKPSPQSEVSFMGYGMLADIDTPADVTIFSVRTSQNELIG